MNKFIVSSAVLCALAPFSAAFGQGLMGTSLQYEYMFPTYGTPYPSFFGSASYTITGAVEIQGDFSAFDVDVTDSQMILTMTSGATWTAADFNGVGWYDITNNLGTITSVTLDPSTNYPGFDASRVIWDGNSFAVNMQGLGASFGSVVVLNIVTPTPGAAAILGLGGLATLRRRRR